MRYTCLVVQIECRVGHYTNGISGLRLWWFPIGVVRQCYNVEVWVVTSVCNFDHSSAV